MSATAHNRYPGDVSATEQNTSRFDLIVVVASLGGLSAFSTVLSGLPRDFAIPVLVVQHRPRLSPSMDPLAIALQRYTPLEVRVAREGAPALTPGVTVVPGGHAVTLDDELRFRLSESNGAGVGDSVMLSAAERLGAATIGVVLTGRLRDGTAGVRALKRCGGRVLVEDPATAQAPDMPTNAIATGCVDFVLPVGRIAAALVALAVAPGGADMFVVPTPPWGRMQA